MAVTAEKVVVELEAEYQKFVQDTAQAAKRFEDSLAGMVSSGRATEAQIKSAFKGIGGAAEDAAKDNAAGAEKAGATFGSRFGIGFLRTALSSILGGAFLAAIVADANAMGDLEDAARRANIPLEKMQEIIFALRREGLSEAQAVKDIERLTQLIADAANNPRNSLRRLFEVNAITIEGKDVNAVIADLARLMQNAPEGMKTKIVELTGLSEKWIDVLEKGPEEFARLQSKAQEAGAVLDTVAFQKAKEFRDNWNEATTRWGDTMRGTINDLLPALNQLITLALQFGSLLGKALSRTGSAAGLLYSELFGGDVNALNEQQLLDLRQIEKLGGNKKRVEEIDRILASRLSSQDFGLPGQIYTPPRQDTGDNSTKLPAPYRRGGGDSKSPYDRAEDVIQKRIALLQAEGEAVGKTRFEQDKLRVSAELLDAARRAGLDTTDPEVIANAERLATAYATVADNTREMKERFQAANEVMRAFGNEAIDGIMGLIEGTKSLNDVFASTLRMLSRMALQAALLGEGPLAKLFGTSSPVQGGTGGLFGALFGGFRAGGGTVEAGKSYVVGERGVEVFTPSVNGMITPNGGSKPSGGDNIAVYADMRDSSAQAIAVLSARIDRLQNELPDVIARTSAEQRRLSPY